MDSTFRRGRIGLSNMLVSGGEYIYRYCCNPFYHNIYRADERYWKQGVKLLGKPVTVGVEGMPVTVGVEGLSSIGIKASLDPSSNGELIITHTLC